MLDASGILLLDHKSNVGLYFQHRFMINPHEGFFLNSITWRDGNAVLGFRNRRGISRRLWSHLPCGMCPIRSRTISRLLTSGTLFHSTDDELIVRTPEGASYNGDGTAKCTFLRCGKTVVPGGGGDMLAIAPEGRSGAVGE